MIREVDLDVFIRAVDAGAVVVDVREPVEYVAGHVPGALLMPLAEVPARAGELPRGEPVYVICASGNRSQGASGRLHAAGVDAYSVMGGTRAWARTGRPLATGTSETAA